MKMHFPATRFFICLLLLLPTGLAFAQANGSALVDCSGITPGAFTSLNSAIFASPDHTTFQVSGTCTENITIQNRNDLNFFGNPTATIQSPDASREVLVISSSRSISFNSNITLKGGIGTVMVNSANIRFLGVNVQDSGQFGLTSTDSVVHLANVSVTGSARTGIVVSGGSFYLDGSVNVGSNGRLGISAGPAAHLSMIDGNGPNIISHNGLAGIQIFGTSQADLSGDNEITNNNTTNTPSMFGMLVQSNTGLTMNNGAISSNSGVGVVCDLHSHCQLSGTHIDSNTAGGLQITEHSMGILGSSDISNNTGAGILVEQGSSLSTGGDTIANNTGDGLILNTLSSLKFFTADTITASVGNLTLNCNNGSIVDGDVSTYKPKKCGAQFQAVPIH
ncbi:MAG TPA: right-handed parallel beta-helix repeat-containing protein [Candidatus Angelobacter sp.]|nr:right-handed parallel beta-helix repeat-containing protein [Candidatus Angelobacter sp.]